jgi:hypothetical protein
MLDILTVAGFKRRLPTSLKFAGFAAAASLAYGLAAASPAAATTTDWQAGCQFKETPQGYGEMVRYAACMRKSDCQKMANAGNPNLLIAGCFGVTPDTAAEAPARRSVH